jgi:single-stranded-DNA-specific exonuclease
MKYKWKLLKQNKPLPSLGDHHPIVQTMLTNLEISGSEIESFLNPSLSNIPSAADLSDIDRACEEIFKYQKNGEKIYIHGDFDADGIVATSILWDFLYRKLNINCVPIIPNRFTEGYGLSTQTMDKVVKSGATLVITVDCGIKDIEIIKKYPQLKFIITDHHSFPTDEIGKKIIPVADNILAIVHPQHPAANYPNQEICGANVAWKLISALNESLDTKFDINEYLGLVALATITDMMPLKSENRTIVKNGVEHLKISTNIGLRTLMDTVSLDAQSIQTYHLGYILGPHFNAAGRMDDALQAVRLLSTQDKTIATRLSKEINILNQTRQSLTEELLKSAEAKVNTEKKLLVVFEKNWPEGIIGLIAGKLCEKYHRPVIVMSIDETNKKIRGSARSISKFNITQALSNVSEFLEKFGGHKQAAGFSVKYDKFDDFVTTITKYVEDNLEAEDLIPEIEITQKLEPADIDHKMIYAIELFEPFGNGNPKPKFLLEDLELTENKIIGNGEKHFKLNLEKNGKNITAVAFNKKDLIKDLEIGDKVDVVGCPNINRWNGNEYLQFEIIDIRKK